MMEPECGSAPKSEVVQVSAVEQQPVGDGHGVPTVVEPVVEQTERESVAELSERESSFVLASDAAEIAL